MKSPIKAAGMKIARDGVVKLAKKLANERAATVEATFDEEKITVRPDNLENIE